MPLLDNDRWGAMRAFEAVGRRLSFVDAAGELDISASALSRRISQLEERLGVRLLHRTTRHATLTEAGENYLIRCRALIDQAEEMDAQAASQTAEPRGTLRVSLPNLYGQLRVAPHLPAFLGRHPQLSLQLLLSDSYVDMVAERIDVAVRIGDLADGDYVARRLASNSRHICASPGYWSRHGMPTKPHHLSKHSCLHFSPLAEGRNWRLQQGARSVDVLIRPIMSADNAEVLRQCALDGRGVALLADFVVGADIAAGRLVPVLTDWTAAQSSIYVAYPVSRYLPLKTRVFVDFLIEAIERTA
jgi:DNA-binding transcriptional LysR family regulator